VIYFVDPVLRAPTIGCMLMCFAAALVGVIVFLRRQSLLGETLSHASYPGIIVGIVASAPFAAKGYEDLPAAIAVIVGAFFSAWLGSCTIEFMKRRLKVHADAALCFVLSVFFGVGLTLASHVQFTHTALYLKMLPFIYGQPATMTDVHIVIYALLSLVIVAVVTLLYKELQAITFDRDYAYSLSINVKVINAIVLFLIVLAVIVGIRSVGVVLMSAMLIAPAAAARQWTNKFGTLLVVASLIGIFSGFFGNVLSVEGARALSRGGVYMHLSLPTGPMIVLVAGFICLLSLLFAPQRGLLQRWRRALRFRFRCVCENVLKTIWYVGPNSKVSVERIRAREEISLFYLRFILWRLKSAGWLEKVSKRRYRLTEDGHKWAAKIVRLHRLWELYLADVVGVGVERVHRSAEEMEHIISEEVEDQLTTMLSNPTSDPHSQPIPPRNVVI